MSHDESLKRTLEERRNERLEAHGSLAAPGWLERSDVIQAIMDEECFDGPMPDEIWERMQTREGAEEILRATVRRVQFNITKRLRSNSALSQGGLRDNVNKQEPQPPLAPANG